jgi:hypothetical protein
MDAGLTFKPRASNDSYGRKAVLEQLLACEVLTLESRCGAGGLGASAQEV